ncbi:MAG: hypothetical protein E7271_06830 [Lachnospiraceae bacterium]|nr:hypothetical protein [Lachnospiraceae bacterium]
MIANDEKLYIHSEIVHKISETIGNVIEYETGGLIGMRENECTDFVFDKGILSDENTYIPDTHFLNDILKRWNALGIDFCGLVHSHKNNPELSADDLKYAVEILKSNDLKEIYMFIYITSRKKLNSYIVTTETVKRVRLVVV